MYLVVIAWLYVVLMMSVAEATDGRSSVVGAILTFFFFGLIPVALVVYLMFASRQRKLRKAREAAERESAVLGDTPSERPPEAGGHAPAAPPQDSVPPVGKET